MIILIIILILCLLSLFFISRRLSPIPYFPTNKHDLPLILKALKLKNNQKIVDLGAGDGKVIFAAASYAHQQKLNTQFFAVEINPVLVLILNLKRLFHPNRRRIKILYADMFKFDLKQLSSFTGSWINQNDIIIFLYISPWFLEKIYKKLKKDLKSFRLISYFYPLPHRKPAKIFSGKNKLFVYS